MDDRTESEEKLLRIIEELRMRVANLERQGVLSQQALTESEELVRVRTGELADESKRLAKSQQALAESEELVRVRTGELLDESERLAGMSQSRDELHQAHDQLELQVQVRTTELKEANYRLARYAAKLEVMNLELQDFTFIASHDLQEPLRKIVAFGDRLRASCVDSLSDEGRDFLERMQNSAKRMRTLIRDLLDFSIVTNKAEPLCTTDLTKVVQEAAIDLEIKIERTGATIKIENLAAIPVDPGRMRRLFQNLIGNSLKFTHEKKPLIRIYGEYSEDKSSYRVSVEDNGIGFDEIFLDRIFSPFQRLHGRFAYEGTGMGLAICRKIMEQHGGSITARSKPDVGSTFILTFPVNDCSGVN